jgi:hypothetical protein
MRINKTASPRASRAANSPPARPHAFEHQEAGINKEERGMRAQDNGHLTKTDRKTLHQQQNQESRRIYRDKHNGKVG